jgi:hypothetical protein
MGTAALAVVLVAGALLAAYLYRPRLPDGEPEQAAALRAFAERAGGVYRPARRGSARPYGEAIIERQGLRLTVATAPEFGAATDDQLTFVELEAPRPYRDGVPVVGARSLRPRGNTLELVFGPTGAPLDRLVEQAVEVALSRLG